jgi:hypothetical protein
MYQSYHNCYHIHRSTPNRNGSNAIAAADARSSSKRNATAAATNGNVNGDAKAVAPVPPSLVSGAQKGGSAKTASSSSSNTAGSCQAVTKPVAALECLNSLQFFCVKVRISSLSCIYMYTLHTTVYFDTLLWLRY